MSDQPCPILAPIWNRPHTVSYIHDPRPECCVVLHLARRNPIRSLFSLGEDPAERPNLNPAGFTTPTMSAWGNGGWKDWGTGDWVDSKKKPINMLNEEEWIDFNQKRDKTSR